MAHRKRDIPTHELDGLRLLALGRIPRCSGCPRFHALVEAHSLGSRIHGSLPGVPEHCTHQVCAPLGARVEEREPDGVATEGSFVHLRAS